MNKIYIISLATIVFFFMHGTSFAKCPEDNLIEQAKQEHINFITNVYDSAVGSPSESRELASCLSSIEEIGNIFSMGISLPSMDDVLDNICNTADSYLQDGINQATNIVNELKNEVTENAIFSVVLNPDNIANELINSLTP